MLLYYNVCDVLSQKPSPVPIHTDFKIKSDDRSTEFMNVFDKSTPLQITIPPPNLASIPTLLSPPSSCEESKPLSDGQAEALMGDRLLKSNSSIAGQYQILLSSSSLLKHLSLIGS